MADPFFLTKSFGFLQFPFRERTGTGRYGQYLVSQCIMRHLQEKGGIHPSGKSHRHTAQVPEDGLELFQFRCIFRILHVKILSGSFSSILQK